MALDRDELNKRRAAREAQRQKRLAEQRKLKILLAVAGVILIACAAAIFLLGRSAGNGATLSTAPSQAATQEAIQPIQETEPAETEKSQFDPITTIHIKAAGDLNITNSVVQSGLAASGYDFTRAFMDVAPVLSDADLTVLNFEGNISGEPYGTAQTSAPAQILSALRSAGVDIVQTANSCSINNGLIGLSATLQAIRAEGLVPLGTYATPSEFNSSKGYIICQVQGVRVAFVAFTKGVGGRGMPAGNESCVNLLYTDYATNYQQVDTEGITKILKNVQAADPDIIIAMLHWGSEFNETISDTQEQIITLMQKRGVDVIIGTHPHVLQQIVFDENKGTLVAYSLGDFYGNGTKGGTNYSIILDIEITKDENTGTTKVTGYSYTPIYTLRGEECDGYHRVVRIAEAMEAYDNNYVDKITASAYSAMEYALVRIEARLHPNVTTQEE